MIGSGVIGSIFLLYPILLIVVDGCHRVGYNRVMVFVRPRIIDFCCKAGGTSMGYHMAGFDVVGIDKKDQPHYPFWLHVADFRFITDRGINNIRRNFDAVAGSPPCQAYTQGIKANQRLMHPNLIPDFRWLCDEIGLPYVIENVEQAPLIHPVTLCGSSFGLRVRRHRLFEANWPIKGIKCNHQWQDRHQPYRRRNTWDRKPRRTGVLNFFSGGGNARRNGMVYSETDMFRIAMGIDWMTGEELGQAIPPVYTYYIGRQLMQII